MASFLDKLKIKTAIDNHVGLDLSCQHISTANFMQMNVAWTKELVPKEKISVNMETFTRLAPMPVPTFGRGKINNRAFFVPFRTIFPAWNDFITDAVHVYSAQDESGLVQHVPLISNLTLLSTVLQRDMSTEMDIDEAYDFEVIPFTEDGEVVDSSKFYKLTAKGRQFVKIIESLGYKIKYGVILDTGSELNSDNVLYAEGNEDLYDVNATFFGVYSALPLLAYLKVYHDWYYPSAYNNLDLSEIIERMFKTDSPEGLKITSRTLSEIFSFTHYVCYDSDYFVSAWDNPYNPSNGTYSSQTMFDPGADIKIVTGDTEPKMYNGQPISNLNSVSQWAIDALKSMTDYMKRHQLVGARALDRYLARFGVNLTAEKLNRSVYLGSQTQNLQFGDVMSTADTGSAALGDYAGKGISYGDGNFEFETDEYGIMIIISTIIPQIGYVEGIDRNVMHITKLDYYTPEFDNLGTQAISRAELYIPQLLDKYGIQVAQGDMVNDFIPYNDDVFGWTPRYAEYKIGRDKMTGDFRCNSINSGQSSWHLFREFGGSLPQDLKHNVEFMQGADSDQYSRIFYNTDAEVADKFNVIYNFNVKSWSPMKSLFDTYEFDSKGKEVTEDVNGVKMN